jgi:hypothetical protein
MTYRPGPLPEPPRENLWGREIVNKLRVELLAIAKTLPTTSPTSGIAVSGYGNRTQITTSGTYVTLKSPLENYIVLFRCENSSGSLVGVDLSAFSSSGFTATPVENGTLYWTPIAV